MFVENQKVITISYELKSADGEILDSSEDDGELSYIHGVGFLPPGFEEVLLGKKVGDTIETVLSPSKGFGEYDENLIFDVDRSEFEPGMNLTEGLEFEAQINDEMRLCTIVAIDNNTISVDANHPLAGEELHIRAEIKGIRDASPEELDHGHVHDGHEEH